MKKQQRQDRNSFIEQLVTDAAQGSRHYFPQRLMWAWGLLSLFVVAACVAFLGPFRAGWANQILSSPRFFSEMLLGALTVVLLIVLAFRSAVPGSNVKNLILLIGAIGGLWLLSIITGFYDPSIESSMVGKREHCAYEILFFSFPPIIIGGVLVMRGYVLNGWLSGLAIGLAAGLISAMLMQIACMYAPIHTLIDHVLPVVFLGLLSAGVGAFIQMRRG